MGFHHHLRVCPWWLAYTFDNPLRRLLHDPKKILDGLVGPGDTALDVGPGLGYFTLALARRVGEKGRVIAADLQQEMLDRLGRRAERKGLLDRITLHRCASDRIGLDGRVDGALAFWMVHEVPDQARFLGEVASLLKDGGYLLVAEPRMHVDQAAFDATVALARAAGLEPQGPRKVALSRSMFFRKASA